ncbi:MAG: hypothetical protein RSA75_09760 [Bacteroidales bacterium]
MKRKVTILWSLLALVGALTFTGCVDYNEPQGIEQMRNAKAEVYKADAAVRTADAKYREAQAATELQNAELMKYTAEQAKYKAEIIKYQAELVKLEVERAALLTKEEQARVDAQIAKYLKLKNDSENALKEANANFEITMLAIQTQLLQQKVGYETALAQLDLLRNTLTGEYLKQLNEHIAAVRKANVAVINKNYDILDLERKKADYINGIDSVGIVKGFELTIENENIKLAVQNKTLARLKEINGVGQADRDALITKYTKEKADTLASLTALVELRKKAEAVKVKTETEFKDYLKTFDETKSKLVVNVPANVQDDYIKNAKFPVMEGGAWFQKNLTGSPLVAKSVNDKGMDVYSFKGEYYNNDNLENNMDWLKQYNSPEYNWWSNSVYGNVIQRLDYQFMLLTDNQVYPFNYDRYQQEISRKGEYESAYNKYKTAYEADLAAWKAAVTVYKAAKDAYFCGSFNVEQGITGLTTVYAKAKNPIDQMQNYYYAEYNDAAWNYKNATNNYNRAKAVYDAIITPTQIDKDNWAAAEKAYTKAGEIFKPISDKFIALQKDATAKLIAYAPLRKALDGFDVPSITYWQYKDEKDQNKGMEEKSMKLADLASYDYATAPRCFLKLNRGYDLLDPVMFANLFLGNNYVKNGTLYPGGDVYNCSSAPVTITQSTFNRLDFTKDQKDAYSIVVKAAYKLWQYKDGWNSGSNPSPQVNETVGGVYEWNGQLVFENEYTGNQYSRSNARGGSYYACDLAKNKVDAFGMVDSYLLMKKEVLALVAEQIKLKDAHIAKYNELDMAKSDAVKIAKNLETLVNAINVYADNLDSWIIELTNTSSIMNKQVEIGNCQKMIAGFEHNIFVAQTNLDNWKKGLGKDAKEKFFASQIDSIQKDIDKAKLKLEELKANFENAVKAKDAFMEILKNANQLQ